jgi:arsenite-transporting ATPase
VSAQVPPIDGSVEESATDNTSAGLPWLLPDGTLPTGRARALVLLVVGKGGVGRTSVSAAIATAASRDGLRCLIVGLDGRPTLRQLCPVGDGPEVKMVSAGTALEDYLLDVGFGGFARRLATSGVIEVVGAAAPGIHDLVVLGRVKQLANDGAWDVIVVDTPAAGHAASMLTSVDGLLDIVDGGPIREQALAVRDMLSDPTRSAVVAVTLAETTPVNETTELLQTCTEVGVRIAGIVVNAVESAPASPIPSGVRGAALWRELHDEAQSRAKAAMAEIDRVHAIAGDVAVAVLARRPVAGMDAATVGALARDLAGGSA